MAASVAAYGESRHLSRLIESLCRVSTPLDNTIYFDKLVQSVTRVVRHAYYPGKDEAIELCLEEIDDLQDLGRITADERATLRELLLGQEDRALLEGVIREREHTEATEGGERIAVFCEGAGSLAAFSAGVLEGLLERVGDPGSIVALGGTAFGAITALLAWDGLLRDDSRRAALKLRGFWHDYSATSLFDGLVNDSIQMMLHLRTLVPLPGLGPLDLAGIGQDQLRCLVERQVDVACARALAAAAGACGLAVTAADCRGRIEVVRGPEIRLEPIVAAAVAPHTLTATGWDTQGDAPVAPCSPVRALFESSPSELWLIQVRRVGRARPSSPADELVDLVDRSEHLLLEQELRFVRTINRLLKRGVLLGDPYRPVEVHRIIVEHDLDDSSRVNRSPGLIDGLITYGRDRAYQFLEKRQQGLARRAQPRLER